MLIQINQTDLNIIHAPIFNVHKTITSNQIISKSNTNQTKLKVQILYKNNK
jgi:hypothetical protein